jgi:hypothetical protein
MEKKFFFKKKSGNPQNQHNNKSRKNLNIKLYKIYMFGKIFGIESYVLSTIVESPKKMYQDYIANLKGSLFKAYIHAYSASVYTLYAIFPLLYPTIDETIAQLTDRLETKTRKKD